MKLKELPSKSECLLMLHMQPDEYYYPFQFKNIIPVGSVYTLFNRLRKKGWVERAKCKPTGYVYLLPIGHRQALDLLRELHLL